MFRPEIRVCSSKLVKERDLHVCGALVRPGILCASLTTGSLFLTVGQTDRNILRSLPIIRGASFAYSGLSGAWTHACRMMIAFYVRVPFFWPFDNCSMGGRRMRSRFCGTPE